MEKEYLKDDGEKKSWVADLFSSAQEKLADFGDAVAEHIAKKIHEREFLPLVTLEDCVQYFKHESKKLTGEPVAMGFVLSVKKNPEPRNENDQLVVAQVLVNTYKEPIVVNGETISRILHARAISDELLRAMDGKEARVFKV